MIAPSRLRRTGILLLVLGAPLAVIGFLMGGDPKTEAYNLMMANGGLANVFSPEVAEQASWLEKRLAASPYVLWSGVAAAAVGGLLWIVGYLKSSDAEIAAAERGEGAAPEWRYRRVGGKSVYYRRADNGMHGVRIDGATSWFETFDQVVDHVRDYRPHQPTADG